MNIAESRADFEKFIVKKATAIDYSFMDNILKQHDDGSYKTTWVDSAWMGWVAALEQYKKPFVSSVKKETGELKRPNYYLDH